MSVEIVYGVGFAFARVIETEGSKPPIVVPALPAELRSWADDTEAIASDSVDLGPSETVHSNGPYLGMVGGNAVALGRDDSREGRKRPKTYLFLVAHGDDGAAVALLTRSEFKSLLAGIRKAAAFADSVSRR